MCWDTFGQTALISHSLVVRVADICNKSPARHILSLFWLLYLSNEVPNAIAYTLAYDGCIWRILHMTDQFSWSQWVRHIQVHLYLSAFKCITKCSNVHNLGLVELYLLGCRQANQIFKLLKGSLVYRFDFVWYLYLCYHWLIETYWTARMQSLTIRYKPQLDIHWNYLFSTCSWGLKPWHMIARLPVWTTRMQSWCSSTKVKSSNSWPDVWANCMPDRKPSAWA